MSLPFLPKIEGIDEKLSGIRDTFFTGLDKTRDAAIKSPVTQAIARADAADLTPIRYLRTTADIIGDIAQSIPQEMAGAFLTAVEAGHNLPQGTLKVSEPQGAFSRALLGTKPIYDLGTQGEEMLKTFGVPEEYAKKQGLTTGVLMLGIDILPGGKNLRTGLSLLKDAKNIDDVAAILRGMKGIDQAKISDDFLNEIAKTTDTKKIENLLQFLKNDEAGTAKGVAETLQAGKKTIPPARKGIDEGVDPLLSVTSGIANRETLAAGKVSGALYELPVEISSKLVTKFGDTVASRIVDAGGKELAVRSLINGGEEEIGRILNMDTVKLAAIKAMDFMRELKPLREQVEAMQSFERARRAGVAGEALERGTGEKAFKAAKAVLRGEMPRPEMMDFKTRMTPQETDTLFDTIRTSELMPYQKITASDGLGKLLGDPFFRGQIPTDGEIKLMREVFGSDFAKAAMELRPKSERIMENIAEVLNVPRAIMSSMDMSAPLRQGLLLMSERPKEFANSFVEMFKYFKDERYFDAAMNDIATRPMASLREASQLDLTDISGKAVKLNAKEEAFMSNLATKIPVFGRLVKSSERAFAGFLNKLRADTFDAVAKEYMAGGIVPSKNPEVFRGLAKFVNTATGRGELGGKLKSAAPLLNTVFFSPRFLMSRVQMFNPQFYLSLPPPVRKMAARSFLKLVGTGVGIVSLANMLGGDNVDVETDPRSSDFGKIRIGNARWDVFGGFQQWFVLGARILTGQSKAASSGTIRELSPNTFPYSTRLDAVMRFGEQRLAPIPGLVTDLLRGQSVVGDELTIKNEAMNKLVPLYIQDIIEAAEEGGVGQAAGVGIPAFFGVGTSVFEPSGKGNVGKLGFPKLPKLPKLPKIGN